MNKLNPLYVALIASAGLYSCSDTSEHNSDAQADSSTRVVRHAEYFTKDPYFINPKQVVSQYGPGSITRDVLIDSNGKIWLASWEGLVSYDGALFTYHTLADNLAACRVFSMAEDSRGNLWFGTLGAGVYKFDGDSFTNYNTSDGLIDNKIQCIYEDRSGNIWFGTNAGLSFYDGKKFSDVDLDQTPLGCIHTVSQDTDGKIWFGTDQGLYIYDRTHIRENLHENGSSFSNVRSVLCSSTGVMWIGSESGLYYFSYPYQTNNINKVASNFVSYIKEDHNGNLIVSAGKHDPMGYNTKGMVLYRLVKGKLTELVHLSEAIDNQIFGMSEDSIGNIWFGSMLGVQKFDGQKATRFNE